MSVERLLHRLERLAQVEVDAIGAYTRAISNCRDTAVADMLASFRDDHERHVTELSDAIHDLGGAVPRRADLSGFAIETFTATASGTGRGGTLMAMDANEVVTNDAWRQFLREDLPPDIRALAERSYRDEQRHLKAIRAALERDVAAGMAASRLAEMQGQFTSVWINVLRHQAASAFWLATGTACVLARVMFRPLSGLAPRGPGRRRGRRAPYP